ncbi:hypothetical protein AWB79_05503 [Caballeronia hypogeia]|uniref:Uncharacterized protein n=1 Tax=Caballeronia hypogeia TaxID=1777140 RepID=A0A158CK27_9BURK|nr:hypothetical protein [Caballeronia hypogeia]SAK82652.1 hypothetical protein AWB79_05503 [Caballeronia hypogeia]
MDQQAQAGPNNFDELIFKRELNEVFLLLDFVSGKADTHIWKLDVDVPVEADLLKQQQAGATSSQVPLPKETPFNIYLRISTMRYPPVQSSTIKAYDATLLLYVKDRLNSFAFPARGATIAYTYMYLAEGVPLELEEATGTKSGEPRQTKSTVASVAYPGLAKSAMRLRNKRIGITFAGIAAFILAMCLLCWTVYGSMILKRFEDDRKSALDIEKSVYAQVATDSSAATGNKKVKGDIALVCCWNSIDDLTSAARALCGTWSYYQSRYDKAIADAGAFAEESRFLTAPFATATVRPYVAKSACPAQADGKTKQIGNASGNTPGAQSASAANAGAAAANGTSQTAAVAVAAASVTAASEDVVRFRQEDMQSIGLVISVYSTYVLPICFGFVGTVASYLRSIGSKTLTSTLGPRDESLAYVRLLLGAIAGIAVGLFYDPTNAAQQISSGSGVMTLSASGIAFLAGYAADAFFVFLDAISERIFNLGSGGPAK